MEITEIFKKIEPPRTLYHYTTAEGLIGILSSKSIWATHVNYLNDKQEFIHIANILKKVMEEEPSLIKFSEIVENIQKELINANFVITSFSAAPDLLSQWRAYSDANSGYCLGFDTKQIIRNQTYYPCIYDEGLQEKIVITLMREFATLLMEYSEEKRGEQFPHIFPKFLSSYIILALFFKNPSFSEEKEWRLLYNPSKSNTLSVRIKNDFIIPYGTYELADTEGKLPINEIIIGPNANPQLSEHSLKILLSKTKLDCIIRTSKIPYRNI